ncbi:MAG: recombination mediator RecR [Candidatus Portnoybacteria bacterium]|jgi:recombination protein RecR|nr:recombination mediator RecR [Candidatus Portnoybacteria bacterium]
MLPSALKNLIEQLSHLPGLGQRSATRLAFYFLNQPEKDLVELAQTLKELKTRTKTCSRCFNLTGGASLCAICSDAKRQQNIICAVEDIMDIIPIERTRQFNGVYHVLGGLISPLDGLTPDKLHIKELTTRLKQLAGNSPEVIFAFNPTSEGDATALYLERLLKPLNAKITRLNRGLSTGSDLEYADETTLINALKYRH